MLGGLLLLAGSLAAAVSAVPAASMRTTSTTAGVRRTAAGLARLERRFWDVADPVHTDYRAFASHPAELREYLASDPGDLAAARAWMERHGCTGCAVAPHTADAVGCDCPVERLLSSGTAAVDKPEAVEFVYQTGEAAVPVMGGFQTWPGRLHQQATARANPPNHGTPARQKASYGIPADLVATNESNLQEVWGCGTFGVNKTELSMYYAKYAPHSSASDVEFDTTHHGVEGGDNFLEGTLDTTYITSFGAGVRTMNSNTNTSMATEEGEGQGVATVFAMEEIALRPKDIPLVLSLSLGSLGYDSCVVLCDEVAAGGGDISFKQCHDYIQQQRQVCLYASYAQQDRINTAFKIMGLRGTTVLGASGDGGSHWSFGAFNAKDRIGAALNVVGCKRMSPLFPANSPYILAVGGVTWVNDDPSQSEAWACQPGAEGGSGGGFSDVFAAPAFQADVVAGYLSKTSGIPGSPPASSYNRSGRAYPDVATFMDGVPLCFGGKCRDSIVGGTSASTPTFAGILSLINDHRLNKGLGPLGYVVQRIWSVATEHPGEAFSDITAGNTSCGCDNGFVATTGWDPLTGFGQPVWAGLVKYLGSD